jgi:hypothetical protein
MARILWVKKLPSQHTAQIYFMFIIYLQIPASSGRALHVRFFCLSTAAIA